MNGGDCGEAYVSGTGVTLRAESVTLSDS